jgi:hypothetical protein
MEEEKVLEITNNMLDVFDKFIKEIDEQILVEKYEIKKRSHRLEILDYERGRAEFSRSCMVDQQKEIFKQEEKE